MKRSVQLLFMLLTANFALAQTWLPVGGGIHPQQNQITNVQTIHYNGDLYVAEADGGSPSALKMYKWDGSSWTTLPSVSLSGWTYITDLIGYQGSVYVIVNGGIQKFDGTTWSTVSLPPATGWLGEMAIINNKLVVSGQFSNTSPGNYIAAEYDGTSWTILPDVGYSGNLYGGNQVLEFNGNIQVLVNSDSSLTVPTNLWTYDGTSWDFAAHNFDNSTITNQEFRTIITDGQKLFGFGYNSGNSVFVVENDSIKLVNTIAGAVSVSDYQMYNGDFYLAGEFGPGSSNTRKSLALFDGQNIVPLQNAPNYYLRSITTDGSTLYGAGNFTSINGVTYNGVVSTLGDVSILQGNVFLDQNSDCQLSSGEIGLHSAFVEINPGNIISSTDKYGNYALGLNPGTYTVGNVNYTHISHQHIASSSCSSTPVVLVSNQTAQQDIASEITITTPDLLSEINAWWRARFGFDENYHLDVINAGPTNETGISVDVSVPAGLQIMNASPAYASQSGSVYTWSISSLNSLETWTANFEVTIDTSVVSMGDSLLFSSSVTTASGEINTANNLSDLWQEVVGAYDPNDKQAEFTEVEPGTSRLEYQIRFQNTGNDVAHKVVVVDTVEAYLYPDQLEMISASHEYDLQIQNNVLTWTFNNILLPDSATDMAGSQGYIRFSMGVDPSLPEGAIIDNDAEIYFDFQQPVHTNHALTTIVKNISVIELSQGQRFIEVYPNPARDIIHIRNIAANSQELMLLNTMGQPVKRFEVETGTEVSYDLSGLPAGMYLLSSENETYRIILSN
ncbi:MAG: T9SS type A sorting domain-containing protein [Owenweeksia sp.]